VAKKLKSDSKVTIAAGKATLHPQLPSLAGHGINSDGFFKEL